ncbi:4a-hydroxytetrahydrobiopterin dehydratase [Streptomyces sp. OZ13]|uniref:4a-hydroxytetrahydrobiopterin dehydratase n=1 Tax=Streptomyces sp. OZ13 TaxID=3452210 RepID=UPI003F8A366D
MGRRPAWSGDTGRLTRTVALPEDRLPPLVDAVRRAGADLSHRADWELTGDGVVFSLRTRSVDAVTRLDLELADRIDAAVEAVGSGGRPG